jgi:PAS domain S-box-containing protein
MSADTTRRRSGRAEQTIPAGQLRLLLDSTRAVSWRGPLHEMRFTSVDARAEELLGFPVSDWYSPEFWRTRIHPDDREATEASFARASRDGVDFQSDLRLVRRDGTHVRVRVVGAPRAGSGDTTEFAGFLLDLTEPILADSAVEDSRHRLDLATSVGRVSTWQLDLASGAIAWDESVVDLLGYSREELSTYDASMRLVQPDDRARLTRYQTSLMDERAARDSRGNTPVPEIEYRIRHRDGGLRWFRAAGTIIRESDGRPVQIVGAIRDVTEQAAEREQREAEDELHRAVLASLPGHVAVVDAHGSIIGVNDAWRDFARVAGANVRRAVLEGENYLAACERAVQAGDEAAARALEGIQSVLRGTEERFRLEYDSTLADERRWYVMLVERLRRANGGAVVTHLDITARKRAELQLQEARQELLRAAQYAAAGELIGAIAHDLRQPLTSIRMNAQTAQHLIAGSAPQVDSVREVLADIVEEDEQAVEILRVMRDLLAHKEPKLELVDPNAICQDVVRLVATEANSRRVSISLRLDPQLKPIAGDRAQLRQALLSLVLNALEANSKREAESALVTIATRVVHGSRVELSISGAPAETGENKAGAERALLGLALVRAVMEAHHGYAFADEDPSVGSVVHMVLPASAQSAGGGV